MIFLNICFSYKIISVQKTIIIIIIIKLIWLSKEAEEV